MKKIIIVVAFFVFLLHSVVFAEAEFNINIDVHAENGEVYLHGNSEPNSYFPIMIFKKTDVDINKENLKDFLINIISCQTDEKGDFETSVLIDNITSGTTYTVVSQGDSFDSVNDSNEFYYPSLQELDDAKLLINSVDSGIKLYSAIVKQKLILGIDDKSETWKKYGKDISNELFKCRPEQGWNFIDKRNEKTSFKNDYHTLLKKYDRYIEAVKCVNLATRESLTNILCDYNDVFELTLSGKYHEIGELKINKILVGKSYENVSEFVEAFKKALDEYEEKDYSVNSGGGGGLSVRASSNEIPINTSSNDIDKTALTDSDGIFKDLSTVIWAKESIDYLANNGLINGKSSGCFAPNDNVTREEFLKMLMGGLDIKTEDSPDVIFEDVSSTDWFSSYINTAYKKGIVKGKSGKVFGVGDEISREDAAVLVKRAMEYKGLELSETLYPEYVDSGDISDYAYDAVNRLSMNGILNGMPNGCFLPNGLLTRAETAVIIYRVINYYKLEGLK